MATNTNIGIANSFKAFGQVLLFFALLVGSFFVGKVFFPKKEYIEVRTEYRDTICLRDTIIVDKPKPEYVYLTRVDTAYLKEVSDTVYVHVEVPIEVKVYQTDEYKAEIQGYNPMLNYIEIYKNTQIVTDYKTITQRINNRWGIGAQLGYSYVPVSNKFYPTVGIGVSYNFITF